MARMLAAVAGYLFNGCCDKGLWGLCADFSCIGWHTQPERANHLTKLNNIITLLWEFPKEGIGKPIIFAIVQTLLLGK